MERIQGASNWKLMIRREAGEITLLRAKTCDKRAVLPDTLFDLPVTALGDHALSPTAPEEQGEMVEITCGPGNGDWDNQAMEELTLPKQLHRIEDYAFFNCRNLRTLNLHDDVRSWGSGVLMNCRSLSEFHIQWGTGEGEALSYFADELSRELDVTLDTPSGRARLIFPEYIEMFEENCAAHHFEYNIQGAGYPYHHCFRWKKFYFLDYDSLWEKYLGMDHDEDTALRLAWWRLQYPAELGEEFRLAYERYLKNHTEEALHWLLETRNASGVASLLKWAEPSRETLSAACETAREQGNTEILAILLETMNRRFSKKKTFDL